jgi:hypothetical protein
MYLSHRCNELVTHIQNTNTQYNLPAFRKNLSRKYNHDGVAERFEDPEVRKSVEVDLEIVEALNQTLKKLEWHIEKTARQHDYHTLYLLRSIPGVGQILALDWQHLPSPTQYTDALTYDDRVLPLARVTP